jgi:hypothetical protein
MALEHQKYTPEFRKEMATFVVEEQRANSSWLATSGSAKDRRAMEEFGEPPGHSWLRCLG